ncbi:MAG TPA: fumarylacetoacetate hydrolase family protein [Bacteroidota bacterium]|nr:fumarylacetoacetate hydrolase family protein [Bacteroidota bacterium]
MKHTIPIRGSVESLQITKIYCLGRNYAEHAKEMNSDVPSNPVVFLKPATALLQDGAPIIRPRISHLLHHEVELYVAIGKGGKHISSNEARNHILGYGICLDMTLRDLQNASKKDGQPWTIAKGFDTSAPVSPIIPAREIEDPHALEIRCSVNGKLRQKSSTGKMIFRIDELIAFISSIFTLEPGDLIFTGTPEGVGEVREGDTVTAELTGHISITHPVSEERPA